MCPVRRCASAVVDPDVGGGMPMRRLTAMVAGEVDEPEAEAFRDQWHQRVQRVLDAPADGGPFTVECDG